MCIRDSRGELSGAGAGGSDHRGRFDFVVLYGDQLDLVRRGYVQRYLADPEIPAVVPEDIRLSGLIPRAAGADDGIQRFVHLHVYLAELVLGAILIFYAAHGVVLAYSALYYHDIGFHGAVRLPAEYESEVRERVGGRLYRWLRLPVVPIYLYQRADLGEQVQRYLR